MQTLSTPAVIINNETYKIVPNSFMYEGGEPEINVRNASAGSGQNSSVHSENVETAIGGCKFDIYLLQNVDRDIAFWKSRIGNNSIQAIQRNSDGTSTTLSFDNQSLVNKVEREASSDGVVSLEWSGDQMASQ